MLGGYNKNSSTFPFSNGRQVFQNEEDLLSYLDENFGKDHSQSIYYSTLNTAPLDLLYDDWTHEQIKRYFHAKQLGTPPYNEDFDNQPAIWIDFADMMNEEIPKIQKELN